MSHNSIKVLGQTLDSNSNINVSLNNLNNVSITSPSENEIIKYDGSNFINSSSTSQKNYDLKASVFQDRGQTYGVSCSSLKQYSVGDYAEHRLLTGSYEKYNDTNFSINSATATNSVITNSKWGESFNIPTSGTYLITATGICRENDITFQLESNSGTFSSKIFCDRDSFFGTLAAGILTVSTTDIVRLVVKAVTADVCISSIDDQDFFTFNIIKLA